MQNGWVIHFEVVSARLVASVFLSSLLLSACSRVGSDLPLIMYVAMVIDQDSTIETAIQADFRRRIQITFSDFRKIQPNVKFQVALYKRSDLVRELRRRDVSDLGPDLIITGAHQSKELLVNGLTEALPIKTFKRNQTEESLWERVKLDDERIAAQPIVIFPQIACFNREIVQKPPSTLKMLLQQGAAGTRVGLPVNLSELLWTAGSLGALPSLALVDSGQMASQASTEPILDWLSWLERASSQENITFFQNQGQLEDLLKDGELDWVSCNANSLLRLRSQMGKKLGVSPLPRGPGGAPSPVNAVRVMALGANSNKRQRQIAISMMKFITNPMVQRNLSLRSRAFLPVNPAVSLPVRSSKTLETLVQSRDDSMQHEASLVRLVHNRNLDRNGSQAIVSLVFGASSPGSSMDTLIKFLKSGS